MIEKFTRLNMSGRVRWTINFGDFFALPEFFDIFSFPLRIHPKSNYVVILKKSLITGPYHCHSVPPILYPSVLRIHVILCAINAVLGVSGNLLTLLAIPYAAKRRL